MVSFNTVIHNFKTFEKAANLLTRLILPPRCLACETLTANQGGLCPDCFNKLSFITKPIDEKSGNPLIFQDAQQDNITEETTPYRKMRAACLYEETAKTLVTSFKYKDRLDLAPFMAKLMALNGKELLKEADIIIPVPLYKSRLVKRRFNQAAELARHLAIQNNLIYKADILKRIKPTKQQTRLSMYERQRNVEGAFHIISENRHLIKGKKIILVDDVVTTGATINACSRALLRDDPLYVDVICFAKVVDQIKEPIYSPI